MSIRKISSGLSKRDVTAENTIADSPSSVSELNKLASDADVTSGRIRELTESVKKAVDKYSAMAESKWAETGRTVLENGQVQDEIGRDRRAKLLRDDIAAYRKSALAMSADEREMLRAELQGIHQKINAVAAMWTDPVAILIRSTVGKRGEYARDVEHSGPAEIDNLLKHAMLTGNRELAAACFSRIDALPSEIRKLVTVSKREVAESLVGEEWRKAREFMSMAEIAIDEAELANMEAEGKAATTHAKLALGMRKKELAAQLGVQHDDGNGATREDDGKTLEQTLDEKYPAVKGSGLHAVANPVEAADNGE